MCIQFCVSVSVSLTGSLIPNCFYFMKTRVRFYKLLAIKVFEVLKVFFCFFFNRASNTGDVSLNETTSSHYCHSSRFHVSCKSLW